MFKSVGINIYLFGPSQAKRPNIYSLGFRQRLGFVLPLKLRRSETRQRAVSLTPRTTPYPALTTSQTETTPPKGHYPHLSKLRLLGCGYVSSDTSGWTVTLRGRPSYVAASTVAASTLFLWLRPLCRRLRPFSPTIGFNWTSLSTLTPPRRS